MYKIKQENFKYTYRSYMACEDQREDDCIGYGTKYVIYKGHKKIKEYYIYSQAKKHLKKLKMSKRFSRSVSKIHKS